jgi:hypothetical protein
MGREAAAVELQWHRLHEMKMENGRRWGVTIFLRGREGGGEAAPRCPWQTTK